MDRCGALSAPARTASATNSASAPVQLEATALRGLENSTRPPRRQRFFLAIIADRANQRGFVGGFQEIRRGHAGLRVHPHVDRCVAAEGKSPIRVVQLERRQPEIEERPVEVAEIAVPQVAEVHGDEPEAPAVLPPPPRRAPGRGAPPPGSRVESRPPVPFYPHPAARGLWPPPPKVPSKVSSLPRTDPRPPRSRAKQREGDGLRRRPE